jgi:uncharacterized repeat protein (TIGR03803 family)
MFSHIEKLTNLVSHHILVITLAVSALVLATVPAQAKEVVIYDQPSNTSGPAYELVADSKGTFYGIADGGGIGYGSVYSLTPPAQGQTAWTETVLYSFLGGTDGIYPLATLTPDGQGGFFGSTTQGGTGPCPLFYGEPGCGTVFHLTPPAQGQTAWTKTTLYSFQGGADGNQPVARLLLDPATGALYGVTFLGGANGAGTVFALAPPAQGQTDWIETVLHTFTGGSDGGYPFAYLIEDAKGVLYGTTQEGGSLGYGAAFTVTPPAQGQTNWTENVIHSFGGWAFSDAGSPDAGFVADSSGNLYSTAADGGTALTNNGAVYELSPPAGEGTDWTETVLYSFTGGKDGAIPANDIIIDSKGAIYSTTDAAGAGKHGTVFKLEPPSGGQTDWTLKVLYSFKGSPDGGQVDGGLTVGKVGKTVVLFGTTLLGGTGGYGTVYDLTGTGFAQ